MIWCIQYFEYVDYIVNKGIQLGGVEYRNNNIREAGCGNNGLPRGPVKT